MGEAQKNHRPGFLGDREAQFRKAYLYRGFCIYSTRYIEGHHSGVRLQPRPEVSHWTRFERFCSSEIFFAEVGLIEICSGRVWCSNFTQHIC